MSRKFNLDRILVPLDGSEYGVRALPWAVALAGQTAELILLEVTPFPDEVRDFRGRLISTAEEISNAYREVATRQLEHAQATWLPDRDNVTLVIQEGDPTEQILWTAEEHDVDLITMSSHGRGAVGRFTSGSVADRVMRHAPHPVMVVGPDSQFTTDTTIDRIITPVDESALSRGALPVAAGIARSADAEVYVVNVLTQSFEEVPTPHAVTALIPGTYYAEHHQEMERRSHELVSKLSDEAAGYGARASGDTFSGTVAGAVEGMVQPGDIIIIASHGRKGLPRWVLGSTAMKLIRAADAPVIVVTREFMERS